MIEKGKIIVFEGLDNSFKETNYKKFVENLKKNYGMEEGKDLITESFPRYNNDITIPLKRWLDGSLNRDILKMIPNAVNTLYSIDRMDFWLNSNHNYLEHRKDYTFVFDRYSLSNGIYNPINLRETTSVDILNDPIAFGIPLPNVIVWMRMKDFDILKSLINKKSGKDENEKDLSFIECVWNNSEKFIQNDKLIDKFGIDLIVIDCIDDNGNIKSEDELEQEVWDKVHPILERPSKQINIENILSREI